MDNIFKNISRAKLLTLKHIFKCFLYILIGAHLALMFQIFVIGNQIVFWFPVIPVAITWTLDFWIKNESSFFIYVF
jgi:hypothetical protein